MLRSWPTGTLVAAGGNSILVVVPDGVVSDLNHWGPSCGFYIDRQTALAALVSRRHQHIPDCAVGNGASSVLEVDSYRINSTGKHLIVGTIYGHMGNGNGGRIMDKNLRRCRKPEDVRNAVCQETACGHGYHRSGGTGSNECQ